MPHRKVWRLIRAGGKRRFLLIFGTIYMLIGYSFLIAPPSGDGRAGLAVALRIVPMAVLAGLWVVAGLLAVVSSLADWLRLGFQALYWVPAVWAVIYLLGWLFAILGLADASPARPGWAVALIWGLLISAVVTVSHMLDGPPKAQR